MKTVKFLLFVVVTSLFTVFISACSENEEESGSLTYKESVVKDFKIYAGSPSGAIEVNGTGFNPEDYWEYFDLNRSDRYENESFTFSGKEIVFNNGKDSQKREYKIEDGKLFSYDPDEREWEMMAYGNTREFRIVSTYMLYKTTGNSASRSSSDEYHTLETVLKTYDISSGEDLTNPTDTVMWCNMEDIFRQ